MTAVGRPLLCREEARSADRALIEGGLPGIVLMENAGRAATDVLVRELGAHLVAPVVVGGTGQNGGDAWVVARHLATRGHRPLAVVVGDEQRVAGDAALALSALRTVGVQPRVVRSAEELGLLVELLSRATVVVDGLFGTGLDRPLAGLAREAVRVMDACQVPKLSLDLPSGVCADTGQVLGAALAADVTVTFHAPKRGLHHPPGAALAGRVHVADIGAPAPTGAGAWLAGADELRASLRRRPLDAHKGTAGHVLVVAGSAGKTGAALLAGLGALRGGAGLVTLAARGAARAALDAKVVELMTREVPEALEAAVATVLADASRAGSAVVGPGLGMDETSRAFARRLALELPVPSVLDADALRSLCDDAGLAQLARAAAPRVLTPHPGEAAQLLGTSIADVQADRFAAAHRLAMLSKQVVVLKGARSLVASPSAVFVCEPGTPALGVAGTGDVLAGVIGARLAERDLAPPGDAVTIAAWQAVVAHALAGERAAAGRDRGLLAREVADAVSFVLGAK